MPTPKGVRVRSTPDWYARFAATGAVDVIGGTSTHFYIISLFNNDTTGAYLFVHNIMCVAEVASAMTMFFRRGAQGALQASCTRINPAIGAPPGEMHFLDNDTTAPPDSIIFLQSTFTGGALIGGAPILIVPPGYSLCFVTDIADGGPGVGVQYIPFTDVYGRTAI